MSTAPEHSREALGREDPAWVQRPIFIVGHPKSGTSLLVSLLDGHPQLVVFPPETHFFRLVAGRRRLFHGEMGELGPEAVAHYILAHSPVGDLRGVRGEGKGGYDLDEQVEFDFEAFAEQVRDRLRTPPHTPARALSGIALAFQRVSPRHRELDDLRGWVEKTPDHWQDVEALHRDFPAARFIHVVRDPRDNYASYAKKHPGLSPHAFAHLWRAALRAAERYAAELGTERYFVLRYEDLLRDPDGMTRRLAAFLGIDYVDELRVPSLFGVSWEGNSMWGDRMSGISTAPIGRYRQWKRPADLGVVEAVVLDEMRRAGYEPESTPSALDQRRHRALAAVEGLRRRVKFGYRGLRHWVHPAGPFSPDAPGPVPLLKRAWRRP